jgi:hypothetical protein
MEVFDGDHLAAWIFLRSRMSEIGTPTGFGAQKADLLRELLAVKTGWDDGSFS